MRLFRPDTFVTVVAAPSGADGRGPADRPAAPPLAGMAASSRQGSRQGSAVAATGPDMDSDLEAPGAGRGQDGESDGLEGEVRPGSQLMQALEKEVAETRGSLRPGQLRGCGLARSCPLCPFRSFGFKQLGRLQDHMAKHHTQQKQFCPSGTKQLKLVLALYDNDQLCGRQGAASYLARSAAILRTTVKPPIPATILRIDKIIRLVLTEHGPEYRHADETGPSGGLRRVRNLLYTKAFSQLIFRETMVNRARVTAMRARAHIIAREAGNEVPGLLPSKSLYWWPLVEDTFSSPPVLDLEKALLDMAVAKTEFVSISMDASVKAALPIMGRPRWKPSRPLRQGVFDGAGSNKAVLSVRGRTGAVLLLKGVRSDSAEDAAAALCEELPAPGRAQTVHIAVDNPSGKLLGLLRPHFCNLQFLSLDPVHLPMSVEYASARRRTPGSRLLRNIMKKFSARGAHKASSAWGPAYVGDEPPPVTDEEKRMLAHVDERSLPMARARQVVKRISPTMPFNARIQFIEAIAALVVMYPDEMDRVAPGPNRTVARILRSAVEPKRIEWYLNTTRAIHHMPPQHIPLLAVGTTSNEALHAELRLWLERANQFHEATLALKLRVLRLAKHFAHNAALYAPTLHQASQADVLAGATARPLWTDEAWLQWCEGQCEGGRKGKASLQLTERRNAQIAAVSAMLRKRPASRAPSGGPAKRTAFTLSRKGGLVSAGVRSSLFSAS